MIVEIKAESIVKTDIEESEAFRILCKTLYMDFVLDEDTDYFVKKDEFGDNAVYTIENGIQHKIDDRGDMFIALRNVAVNMFPNLSFRNADYIYNK